MNGEQYLANTHKMQVHDLDNEKTGKDQCQIDEIIKAGHEQPYTSNTNAKNAGYKDCEHCLPKK